MIQRFQLEIRITLSALLILAINSCGPTATERVDREKFIADSVATAIKTKLVLTDSLAKQEQLKQENELALKKDEEDMNVANAKMQSIQEYTFLRTASEKEDQIRNQTQEIQNIREAIELHTKNIQVLTAKVASLKNELVKYQ